ncbi:poly(A) polymerase gamma-like [Eudromia elegans]
MEARVTIRTSGPPCIGCTIPTVVGHGTISRLRAHHAQGQQEIHQTPTAISKYAAPKRPHSPASEECPKRLKDTEKLIAQDSTFKDGGNPEDVKRKSTENDGFRRKSMPIPIIDTSRSQRLSSKELPDSSSPVPTNNIRIIKRSIRLTLNR